MDEVKSKVLKELLSVYNIEDLLEEMEVEAYKAQHKYYIVTIIII